MIIICTELIKTELLYEIQHFYSMRTVITKRIEHEKKMYIKMRVVKIIIIVRMVDFKQSYCYREQIYILTRI